MSGLIGRWMTVATAAAMLVAAAPASGQAAVKTATYSFDYSYPAAAARYPALRRWLDADRAALRATLAADAARGRHEATRDGFPFHAYEAQREWKVVTETPRFLSLSNTTYTFSGGAHGGTQSAGLLWDKATGRRLAPRDLFVSAGALQAALGAGYCRALNVERQKRRGDPVRGDDPFNRCVKVSETTLLLGSTDRRRFDRVGLIADQYVAGSYAEGAYEVTLPVTPALLAAVKPAYRGAFALR